HPDRDRRSLAISLGQDGRTLVFCHAQQCPAEAIVRACHLSLKDLAARNGHAGSGALIAQWNYTDEAGNLLYQVVRFAPKEFRQRRPEGTGGWIWDLKGVEKVLYRLHELQGQPRVVVVEGERDADSLWRIGIAATTNSGGAGKWKRTYAADLVAAGAEQV